VSDSALVFANFELHVVAGEDRRGMARGAPSKRIRRDSETSLCLVLGLYLQGAVGRVSKLYSTVAYLTRKTRSDDGGKCVF
jgi:hypothetical protein